MKYVEGKNNLNITAKTKLCLVGLVFSDFCEKTLSIDLSQYIQTGVAMICFVVDDIHREKGACGRSENQVAREHFDVSLCSTRLTWTKPPAAAMTTKTNP